MTTIDIDFPDLDAAMDAESWDWLWRNAEFYARAIQREVGRGRTPEQIRQRFSRRCGGLRNEMALRLEQAARHLVTERTKSE